MNFFRKYKVHILVFVIAAFGLTLALNFGQLAGLKGAPTDTAIEVNGDSIPLYLFENYYLRALEQLPPNQSATQEQRNDKRNETVRELVTQTVMEQQARHFGIEVPDQQVIMSLMSVPAFQQNGKFSPEAYQRALAYSLKTSPQEFEEEQRRQLSIYKLSWLIRSVIRMTDKEYEMAYPVLAPTITKEIQAESKKPLTPDQLRAAVRDRMNQALTNWTMNQWYSSLNQNIKVKVHNDILQELK